MPTLEEYIEEIKNLWDSKYLTNHGPKHELLEKELCKYLECPNMSLFVNGHMALYTTLKLLDLKGEVITTPFTFASTTHAIVQNGLTPVFCDIKEDDYTIDTDKIESLITPKTSAILAVHVYGNPCNVEKMEEIAKKHHLKVIYDAAHAFGVKYKGESIANFGDITMFSFHATKVFNTIEGGGCSYKNHEWYMDLLKMNNFGIWDEEEVRLAGFNGKMNEFQAAMGLCNLKHIDEELKKRKIVFERYLENLKDIKGIKIPTLREDTLYNYAYFPILILNDFPYTRDEVIALFNEENIYPRKYFYPLVSDFECYKNKYNSNDTPIAKEISSKVMTLPLYADLDLEMVDKICNIIKKNSRERRLWNQ